MVQVLALVGLCLFSSLYALQDTPSHAEVSAFQEKPSLVLYYSSHCPYSQKVLRYLQKIDKTIPMKNVIDNPQYKKELSQAGDQLLVPCLVINGKAIYDADLIIEWLSSHQEQLESIHK